jgi:nucleotide-binding universal stress UspA family protein
MSDTILQKTAVPLDGSTVAEAALDAIVPLVQKAGGEVVLIMVLDDVVEHGFSDFANAEGIRVVEAADQVLVRVQAGLQAQGLAVTSHLVDADSAAEGILATVGDEGCTAIALASHGRSGFTKWLMGSVADKVLRSADVPVLVIPAR